MAHEDHKSVHVYINRSRYSFEHREQTGRALKERACIPINHVLCMEPGHHPEQNDECSCERKHGELHVVSDDQIVLIENGEHFWSVASATHGVTVKIDRKEYDFADPHQTGRSIKERAGIPLTDVLFLDRPHEDEVIADDTKITLRCDDCFHSAPPANYGGPALDAASVGSDRFEVVKQADGWTFLIVNTYALPEGYAPSLARILVKLAPTFPDAAPDMFWLNPHIKTAAGAAPQGTSTEALLGEQWQRFSWHLLPGAWHPETSTLRDYMRCVRARLEKRN